jgi:hypothetical protein
MAKTRTATPGIAKKPPQPHPKNHFTHTSVAVRQTRLAATVTAPLARSAYNTEDQYYGM